MCDTRERLIDYVYDECGEHDRREIQDHLTGCGSCRTELEGLRRVRQELLAWHVPETNSVWRPFAAARPVFSWRDVPAWALAAAAALMLSAGGVGGAVTYAMLGHPAAVVSAVAGPAAAPTVRVPAAAVTSAELTALEDRLMSKMRAELDTRIHLVSAHAAQPELVRASTLAATEPSRDDLLRQINALRRSQIESLGSVWTDMQRLNNRQRNLEQGQGLVLTSLAQRGAVANEAIVNDR
jgi:hypothetical protein